RRTGTPEDGIPSSWGSGSRTDAGTAGGLRRHQPTMVICTHPSCVACASSRAPEGSTDTSTTVAPAVGPARPDPAPGSRGATSTTRARMWRVLPASGVEDRISTAVPGTRCGASTAGALIAIIDDP